MPEKAPNTNKENKEVTLENIKKYLKNNLRSIAILLFVIIGLSIVILYSYSLGKQSVNNQIVGNLDNTTSTLLLHSEEVNEKSATDNISGNAIPVKKTSTLTYIGSGLIGVSTNTPPATFQVYKDHDMKDYQIKMCSPARFINIGDYSLNLAFYDKTSPYCVRFYLTNPVLTATTWATGTYTPSSEKLAVGEFEFHTTRKETVTGKRQDNKYVIFYTYPEYRHSKTLLRLSTLSNASVSLAFEPQFLLRFTEVENLNTFVPMQMGASDILKYPIYYEKNDKAMVLSQEHLWEHLINLMPVVPKELQTPKKDFVFISSVLQIDVPIYLSEDALVITATGNIPLPHLQKKTQTVDLPISGNFNINGIEGKVISEDKGVKVLINTDNLGGALSEIFNPRFSP